MNVRLHLCCQRFHFYKQSINSRQQRNRHHAGDTLHKKKIPHKTKCDYAVIPHHTNYAVAKEVHSPSMQKLHKLAQAWPRSLRWIKLQRNNQQKIGKKDNSRPQLGCNSTLFSPSQPRQHPGSYPYVDCCLLPSQPNDALRPSAVVCRSPVFHGRKASRSVHCLNRPSLRVDSFLRRFVSSSSPDPTPMIPLLTPEMSRSSLSITTTNKRRKLKRSLLTERIN